MGAGSCVIDNVLMKYFVNTVRKDTNYLSQDSLSPGIMDCWAAWHDWSCYKSKITKKKKNTDTKILNKRNNTAYYIQTFKNGNNGESPPKKH